MKLDALDVALRVTPAMEAGVADHVWTMEEIAALIDRYTEPPKPCGPYKKRQPAAA